MTKKLIISLFLLITVLIAGCSNQTTDQSTSIPTISTIFYPVEEITKQIVQDKANVVVVIPQGSDPHSFEPTPNQIVTFANSQVFVTMDGMFEHIEEKIINTNSEIKIIDSTHHLHLIEDKHEHEEHTQNYIEIEYHKEHNEIKYHLDVTLPNPCYSVIENIEYVGEDLIIDLSIEYTAPEDMMCTQALVETHFESEIELNQEIHDIIIRLNGEEITHKDIHDLNDHQEEHHTEDEHNHNHGEFDPHVWLSIHNMIDMTKEISEELSKLYPEHADFFTKNGEDYVVKLEELEEKFEQRLSSCEFDKIIVNHKAFGYIAEEFGFEQISVAGFSPESEPTPQTIQNVINTAKEYNLKYVFSEGQLDSRVAQTIANDINGEVLELNPVKLQRHESYIQVMEENLENLAKGLNCN